MRFARRRTLFIPFPARRARHGQAKFEGEDYHFISEQEFLDARRSAGDFWNTPKCTAHYYGTLRKPILDNLKNGVDVLIDVDTQGAAAIRNYDDPFIRQALTDVFIMPPDLDELRRRLTKRGTETPQADRAAPCQRRAGDGALARLPLHHHQQIGGGRFA